MVIIMQRTEGEESCEAYQSLWLSFTGLSCLRTDKSKTNQFNVKKATKKQKQNKTKKSKQKQTNKKTYVTKELYYLN